MGGRRSVAHGQSRLGKLRRRHGSSVASTFAIRAKEIVVEGVALGAFELVQINLFSVRTVTGRMSVP